MVKNALSKAVVAMGTAALLGIGAALGAPAAENDWPVWRGPDNDGISRETAWKPEALAQPKTLWKASLGSGYSTVSIKGDRLYTMGNRNDEDVVYCLDPEKGTEIWKKSYPCGKGSYPGPRSTPLAEGDVVYTFGREGQIICWKAADGSIVWQKNAVSDFGAKNLTWSFASSPRTDGDVLVLNAGLHGLVLNKKTGEKVWSSGAAAGGYSSAVFYGAGPKRAVVMFGQKAIYGANMKDGQKLWSFPWETSYDVHAADPIVVGSQVFFSSGYNTGCAVIDVSGAEAKEVWRNKSMRNHFSSCVLIDGHIYGIDGNAGGGDLACLEFKTGAEKWRQKLGFGSLIGAADKLIVLNENGMLFAAKASPSGYEELGKGPSGLTKTCWTPPVLCRGLLYCRNEKGEMVCLDLR